MWKRFKPGEGFLHDWKTSHNILEGSLEAQIKTV